MGWGDILKSKKVKGAFLSAKKSEGMPLFPSPGSYEPELMLHWRFTYVIMDPKPYKESKNGRT
jgi:hypothetical protein